MKDNTININYPILSICIPTYNRPEKLNKNLNLLLPQLNNSMEIVIRDDSTNFKTKRIIEKFKRKYSIEISYYKGNKIGLDKANIFLLEKSRGEFIWWLSDDDILVNGSIKEVVKVIKKYSKVNYIFVNFGYGSLSNLAVSREDGLFKDRNEVLCKLGTSIGLLSTYILRRSVAITGIEYGRKNSHGFSFALTAILFWVLTQPGKSYFLKGPYILNKPTTVDEIKDLVINRKIENLGFLVYGIYFHDALYGLKSSFDKRAVKKMLRTNFNHLWKGMIVGWLGGWDNPRGKRLKMIKYYWYFYECWIAIILMIMPKVFSKFLYGFYIRFIKNTQKKRTLKFKNEKH